MGHNIFSMRLLVTALSIVLSSVVMAGGGNNQKDAPKAKSAKQAPVPDCLEVCAQAMLDGQAQTGVTIKLYCDNEQITSIDSTEFGKVYFTLKRDRYYTVEITKEGYVPRLVGISTFVPKIIPLKPIFRFEFEVDMLKKVEGQDNFYIDFPVALVSFNSSKECFEHSKKYTSRIKREIAKESKAAAMAAKE